MNQLDKLMSYGIRSYISCFVCHLALVIESADHTPKVASKAMDIRLTCETSCKTSSGSTVKVLCEFKVNHLSRRIDQ